MARVIGKSKSVPAIPGKESAGMPPCAPCGAYGLGIRVRTVIDGIDMAVCLDPAACCGRYRGGRTPAEYATNLRAEVAA